MLNLNNKWGELLAEEFKKEYFLKLSAFLEEEYASGEVFPPKNEVLNALKITDYPSVKAVILGQDPYHEKNQAHGLAFSVKSGVKAPPSLVNIFKEYADDLGYPVPKTTELTSWARNGVLLLNTVLTVREGEAASHAGKGWEQFTDRIISLINEKSEPVVFILWGSHAQKKAALITSPAHKIISSPHPSPLSSYRGFFGSKPFSKANELLGDAIDWRLE